jgi:hypothetical protein
VTRGTIDFESERNKRKSYCGGNNSSKKRGREIWAKRDAFTVPRRRA